MINYNEGSAILTGMSKNNQNNLIATFESYYSSIKKDIFFEIYYNSIKISDEDKKIIDTDFLNFKEQSFLYFNNFLQD